MIAAGERLVQLAGRAGTAGELLRLIGAGSTAAAILVDYSQTVAGTAASRLLVHHTAPDDWLTVMGGSVAVKRGRSKKRNKDLEMLLFTGAIAV